MFTSMQTLTLYYNYLSRNARMYRVRQVIENKLYGKAEIENNQYIFLIVFLDKQSA